MINNPSALTPMPEAMTQLVVGGAAVNSVANLLDVAKLWLPHNCLVTGLSTFIFTPGAGNLIACLYDVNGNRVAVSASTGISGVSTVQRIPFTAQYNAAAGPYFSGIIASASIAQLFVGDRVLGEAALLAQGGFAAPASITPPAVPDGANLHVSIGTY